MEEEATQILCEGWHETLKSLITKAIQFQKHRRCEKLTASHLENVHFFLLSERDEQSKTAVNNIDLESDFEQRLENLPEVSYSAKDLSCSKSVLSKYSKMDKNLEDYFVFTCKVLFAENCELDVFLLKDLTKNPYILPLVPIFLDCLCNDYILIKYKSVILKRILSLMSSLFLNPFLCFRNQDTYKLLRFLLSCVTSNLPSMCDSSVKDDCLQIDASKFLKQILIKSPQSKFLYNYSLSELQVPLEASEIKLQQCYGSLIALIEIGLPAVARVISRVFPHFSQKLEKEMFHGNHSPQNNNQNMAAAVYTKFFVACELLLKHYSLSHESMHSSEIKLSCCHTFSTLSNSFICEEVGDESVIKETLENIHEYFGDMIM